MKAVVKREWCGCPGKPRPLPWVPVIATYCAAAPAASVLVQGLWMVISRRSIPSLMGRSRVGAINLLLPPPLGG